MRVVRGAPSRIAAVGLSASAAILLAIPPASAGTGGIVEFAIPTVSSLPQGIAAGSDGAMWFVERNANKVGRVATDGTFTEYPLPGTGAQPFWITAGPDGNLWFTERSANRIGRVTPAGAITEFAVPTAASQPAGIAAGPDGALWFAEQSGSKIGRITTDGSITEFPTSTARSGPYGISRGPDGAMWFTEQGANKIGRITTGGAVTEVTVTPSLRLLSGITAGPDGNEWFTERTGQAVGYVTLDMTSIVTFDLPSGGSPVGIAAGFDGKLWFTENSGNRIGSITPGGTFTEYDVPTASSQPFGIAAVLGGVWFTEQAGNMVGNLVTDTTPPTVDLVSPPDGASYLVGTPVMADYSCADTGGSGLATCAGPVPSGSAIDTTTPGNHSFSITATDGAGNQTVVTHAYRVLVDSTSPTISLLTPPDGASYLVGTPVTADYSCADTGGSGLATCAGPVPSGSAIDTTTPGNHSFSITATDGAGNQTVVTHAYDVFADTTPPTVDLVSPPDGAWYLARSAVLGNYSCGDAGGSGLATCAGPVPSGAAIDTAAGPHSFTVRATDGAGNATVVTHRYVAFVSIDGAIVDGKAHQAGSALTTMLDPGAAAAAATLGAKASRTNRAGTTPQAPQPLTQQVRCDDPSVAVGPAIPADVQTHLDGSGQLHVQWKSAGSWAGTCRTLVLPFDVLGWTGANVTFLVRFS